MVEQHKHSDWIHLVHEFRLVLVQDKMVELEYSMAHVCLSLIDDYSHVLQNFSSDGWVMAFEKNFSSSVSHLTIEREKNGKKMMFVDVVNGIHSLSFE